MTTIECIRERDQMLVDSLKVGIDELIRSCQYPSSRISTCRGISDLIEDIQNLGANLDVCLNSLHRALQLAKRKDWQSCLIDLHLARCYLVNI